MADIELVIKIPEDIYKDIVENGFIYDADNEEVTDVIKNGIPLDDIKKEIDKKSDMHMDGEFYVRNLDVKYILDRNKENLTR